MTHFIENRVDNKSFLIKSKRNNFPRFAFLLNNNNNGYTSTY
jgi:hypothetical protein